MARHDREFFDGEDYSGQCPYVANCVTGLYTPANRDHLIRHPLQIVGFSLSLTVIPLRNYCSSIDTTIPVRIIYFFHRKHVS